MNRSVCFDVLGTCFGFEKAIAAIEERMGARLRTIDVDSKTLFFSWFFTAQRDFAFTSIAGKYVPIAQVLKHTFNRACRIVDLPAGQAPTEDDITAIMGAVTSLGARPGLKLCFDGLREAGWDVFGVTNGGKETSLGYFKTANIALIEDHLLSCDEIRVAKPDVRVYDRAHDHLDAKGADGARWFVSAHAWDLLAAKQAGFKTAYLYFEEHDPAEQVFGTFDLYADTMEQLLKVLKDV